MEKKKPVFEECGNFRTFDAALHCVFDAIRTQDKNSFNALSALLEAVWEQNQRLVEINETLEKRLSSIEKASSYPP